MNKVEKKEFLSKCDKPDGFTGYEVGRTFWKGLRLFMQRRITVVMKSGCEIFGEIKRINHDRMMKFERLELVIGPTDTNSLNGTTIPMKDIVDIRDEEVLNIMQDPNLIKNLGLENEVNGSMLLKFFKEQYQEFGKSSTPKEFFSTTMMDKMQLDFIKKIRDTKKVTPNKDEAVVEYVKELCRKLYLLNATENLIHDLEVGQDSGICEVNYDNIPMPLTLSEQIQLKNKQQCPNSSEEICILPPPKKEPEGEMSIKTMLERKKKPETEPLPQQPEPIQEPKPERPLDEDEREEKDYVPSTEQYGGQSIMSFEEDKPDFSLQDTLSRKSTRKRGGRKSDYPTRGEW